MTANFIIASILFLLTTVAWHTKTETAWSTQSDAVEEEEKKQNILSGQEDFPSTAVSEDSPVEFNFGDRVSKDQGNDLWSRPLNFSDYDELQEDNKHDSSPEDSVDRNSLDSINKVPQEGPNTESPAVLPSDSNSSSTQSVFSSFNDSTSQSNEISSNSDNATVTSNICVFGDRNCKSSQTDETQSKANDKSFTSQFSNTFSPTPGVWNPVKSLKSQNDSTSERLEISISTANTPIFIGPSIRPSTSRPAQTSENVILVDGGVVDKDEAVIHLNKTDKLKSLKPNDGFEELSDLKNISKVVTPTFDMKETTEISIVDSSTEMSNKILDISLSNIELIARVTSPSLITPTDKVSKTDTFTMPQSDFAGKIQEKPSLEYSKESNLNLLPTQSFYDPKNNIAIDTDKRLKWVTKDVPAVTPLIYSSFQETSSVIETISVKAPLSTSSDTSSSSPTVSTSDFLTPVLDESFNTRFTMKDDSNAALPPELNPPPRLTNPTCSSLPICVEITLLEITWEQFCIQADEFRVFLSKSVSYYTRPIHPRQFVLEAEICSKSFAVKPLQSSPDITIAFYVTNDTGEYEERLTEICGIVLKKWAPTSFHSSIIQVRLYNSELESTSLPLIPELNTGFVAAVSISAVAGVALCLLCILLVVMKQKLVQGRNSDNTNPTSDAYSLDSLSINASFRRRRGRRSAKSYLNHAFSDQEMTSHPMNEKTLVGSLKSKDILEDEFRKIPMNMPKLDAIPEGAHVKNRYSNILPKPESRVVLAEPSGDPFKCYINANYIKGYGGKSAFYIACQAPLPEGIEDFWKMIWEQQSRVIIMLTMFEENGTSRCAQYFPQSTLISQPPFGDFQISLLKKDVFEFYTVSTLRLLDMERNLFRDIVHLWFTGWPDVGVPKDPSSLITFVQQCRTFINSNSGPTIVHCSTGTGRTGVFLALDICMREYDESRSIDILQCVSQLRRDRGGAVQNKDQYVLIHEAMLEYVSRVATQNGSTHIS